MGCEKSQEQKGGHERGTERQQQSSLCFIDARVVLRRDIVKDDSGAYGVFTEQGSSASQLTAAKVVDVVARLPDCDGQAAGAISTLTQVKREDAQKLL